MLSRRMSPLSSSPSLDLPLATWPICVSLRHGFPLTPSIKRASPWLARQGGGAGGGRLRRGGAGGVELFLGAGEVGLERRIGLQARDDGRADDAARLDVAGVVDAAHRAAFAIGQSAPQDGVGAVGRQFG